MHVVLDEAMDEVVPFGEVASPAGGSEEFDEGFDVDGEAVAFPADGDGEAALQPAQRRHWTFVQNMNPFPLFAFPASSPSVGQPVSPCPDASHLERRKAPRLERRAREPKGVWARRPTTISSLRA